MKTLGPIRLNRFRVPSSLRFQLLSRSLLVLAGLLILIGVFQYLLMYDFIYKNQAVSIQTQILSMPKDSWLQYGRRPNIDNRGRVPLFFFPESSIVFVDVLGNYYSISDWPEQITPIRLSAEDYLNAMKSKKQLNYKVMDNDSGDKQLVVLQPIEARGNLLGVVQASMNTHSLDELLNRQQWIFLALSALALIAGVAAFLPVLKKTLVPLSNMVDKVERIDAGNLAERFPDHQGQLEVDRLAVSFNGMLERLEASFEAEKEAKEQMRRFIADASHELRTPLTSIHGFLEVLLRGAMNQPGQLHKALNSMHGESERINKLVQDLILLAKLDRAPHVELTSGMLDAVIRDMEPQLRLLAGSREVDFRICSGMSCKFDKDKMKQVILNLFHNAVQHTEAEKGHIEISLQPSDGGVQLTVRDNGPGIGGEHLPYVFDRFYRSDSSRTRKYGGAGLGLSITKSIVEVHGGRIRVESKEGEGCAFHVWLPAHDS